MTTDSLPQIPQQPSTTFLEHVTNQFITPLSIDRLLTLATALHKSYVHAAKKSPSQMLPSHITTLPSGRERGQYLAVDLGGTNMRVALVRLRDNEATVEKLHKHIIPEQVKTGTAERFFEWIAKRIVELTKESTLDEGEHEWKLGVTWSFPFAYYPLPIHPSPFPSGMQDSANGSQNAVNRGTIHQMGKGFNIPSIVNASLTDLLHDSFAALSPPHPIQITALLNDAVATLLSHAFIRPMTRMGLICGTGTNATCLCPTEYLSEEKYHHETGSRAWEEFVLVNTEWSMFGRGVLPVTEYDRQVDKESGMPGFQPFEMMVSGRYIGEIVRLVCLDGLLHQAWSFTHPPQSWTQKWGIQTATCSMVETYSPHLTLSNDSNASDTQKTVDLLNLAHPVQKGTWTHADADLFLKISMAVSTRSASLVATSTIALLNVNNELSKIPVRNGSASWCGSSSTGTPSPSDSGLGSMDDDARWTSSRRGSLFSAQGLGSRRSSLASPVPKMGLQNGITVDIRTEDGRLTLTRDSPAIPQNLTGAILVEDPSEMSDDDDEDTVVVAFCGSVMEKYSTFRERCQKILDELVTCPNIASGLVGFGGQRRVVLEENGDGGILGAGILAAVVDNRELSDSVAETVK